MSSTGFSYLPFPESPALGYSDPLSVLKFPPHPSLETTPHATSSLVGCSHEAFGEALRPHQGTAMHRAAPPRNENKRLHLLFATECKPFEVGNHLQPPSLPHDVWQDVLFKVAAN